MGQVDTMPTATADNYGTVVQYIGATTNDYTHGYFYECTRAMGTQLYYWMNVPVSEGGSGSGHVIEDTDGNTMTQRAGLQFEGIYVTDDSTNDKTKVGIPQFTQAEWDALSSAQKAAYNGCQVIIKDDYGCLFHGYTQNGLTLNTTYFDYEFFGYAKAENIIIVSGRIKTEQAVSADTYIAQGLPLIDSIPSSLAEKGIIGIVDEGGNPMHVNYAGTLNVSSSIAANTLMRFTFSYATSEVLTR